MISTIADWLIILLVIGGIIQYIIETRRANYEEEEKDDDVIEAEVWRERCADYKRKYEEAEFERERLEGLLKKSEAQQSYARERANRLCGTEQASVEDPYAHLRWRFL